MGLDVEVRLRFLVKNGGVENNDDGERLFGLLAELSADGIRKLEPMRIIRNVRLDQLQCTTESYLRTKTGFERFLDKSKFSNTYLPTLCRKYEIEAEVWTSCGEAGYNEHIIVGYDGKILTKQSFNTTPDAGCSPEWSPSPEEAQRASSWGKWTIPFRSEYDEKPRLTRAAIKEIAEEGIPF